MVSTTSLVVTSSTSASSSGDGSRSNFCSNAENVFEILFKEPYPVQGQAEQYETVLPMLEELTV